MRIRICVIWRRIIKISAARCAFTGSVKTLVTFEDNTKVRAAVEQAGDGRVLSGRWRRLDELRAIWRQSWPSWRRKMAGPGIIIHGCVRDRAELAAEAVGIKALASHPKKSDKRDLGTYDVSLKFSGVTLHPGRLDLCR